MSDSDTRCEKGKEINHPGAFGRHAKACDVCTREGDSGGEGSALEDIPVTDIRRAVREAPAEQIDATLEAQGYKPGKSDTREEAAAKSLIRAKDGGKEAYQAVFDTCAVEDCEYGCNGFDERTCRSHGPEDLGEASEEPEEPDYQEKAEDLTYADTDTREAPREDTRVDYVAALIARGVPPEKAEQAASARWREA